MDVLEIASAKEVNWALEVWMCSVQERQRVGLQSRKGEIIKSDSASKYMLALPVFTQDDTESNVKCSKYKKSKLFFFRYDSTWKDVKNRQFLKRNYILSSMNSGAFNCQLFISAVIMTVLQLCS